MTAPYRAAISGLGAYLPEKILKNSDLEKMVETTDEWIRTRTGIRERHIAAAEQATSDLALPAAQEALRNAGLTPRDLGLIIVATTSPDMVFPSAACYLQTKLGASCGAFDLAAACSGFVYALSVAEGFVKSGIHQHVLVVGAETISRFINWKDRSTCVLFGDGAGAAVVSRSLDGHGILASCLGADGAQSEILQIPAGGSRMPPSSESIANGQHYIRMDGPSLFKIAVKTMDQAVRDVLKRENLEVKDIHCLIPHQANHRILQAVADRLEIASDRVYINVDRYGNMSSASTVIGLYEAVKSGVVKKGDYVVLVAFGGGLTWGATLIQW
ncbi:MAG TPA: beta-ketoacyl-ACP synthase III [Candidatus Omnitrophota bacterium]|nr:beta-ketoacyl-ACP synthase III [Candidatus Omnitrophota bacterium]HPS37482.1 beta-ketoacyl-ACP synthase III [Candidatus Omnitrophota bacterium]